MFTNETVFVLGAGASRHYGYPTGEGLIENVISMASRLASHCDERLKCGQVVQVVPDYVEQHINRGSGFSGSTGGWKYVREECRHLVDRLRTVRPLLIDHFLAWNEGLRPIGKLMIAAAILECEAAWLREQANQNRRSAYAGKPEKPAYDDLTRLDITKFRDDWYRFVVHKLVT